MDPQRRLTDAALHWLSAGAARAADALADLEQARGEVRVRIVADAEMAAAHERYKGAPETTDVLTFDLSDAGTPLDVDVLVCADEAARQARARGLTQERELLLYIVHGALHCLGYDDESDEGERGGLAMHTREDEILERIGVGPTYAQEDAGVTGVRA